MSRNFAALQSLVSNVSVPSRATQAMREPGTYLELIRRFFRSRSTVAIVGGAVGLDAINVCDGIAAELAASGKRVVVVPVDTLLRMNPLPIPDETAFISGSASNIAHNIWTWPQADGQKIDFFKSREPEGSSHWLEYLRRHFDSVLLDCPAVQVTAGVAEVAAIADAAVLVVEAGRTQRQKIQLDQHTLQFAGVKLAGCILIQRR
jgi:hypothetical protein